jgi:hypothetical protein
MQSVARRNAKVVNFVSQVHVFKLSSGALCYIRWKPLGFAFGEKVEAKLISKGLYHALM